MYMDFSGLFHQSSKDRQAGGRVRIPFDTNQWPEEWKEIAYKEYARLPKLALEDAHPSADLFGTIEARASRRDFAGRSISSRDLAVLLRYSCGLVAPEKGSHRRAQPSGGARYPIETYPVLFVPSDVPSGVYHYNVRDHALDSLWRREFKTNDLASFFTYPWAKNASIAIFLTGVFHRNQIKYGERGYRHILIEAGAILQNVYLVAEALGMQCCAIDGINDRAIEGLLDIDGIAESLICGIILG